MKNFEIINNEELESIKGGIFSETLGEGWDWEPDEAFSSTVGGSINFTLNVAIG